MCSLKTIQDNKNNMKNLFVAEIFSRYGSHLMDVITSIETQISFYQKSKDELERLSKFKPEVYSKELEKINFKIKEADKKLSYIVPRVQEMAQTLNDIREVYEANEDIKKLADNFISKVK